MKILPRTAAWWLSLALPCLSSAELLSGNGIEVIDQLAASHPQVRIGVDPAVASTVLRTELAVNDSPQWQSALKTALSAHDLTILPIRELKVLMVTEPTATRVRDATKALRAGGLDSGLSSFKGILAQYPESFSARVMVDTLEKIDSHTKAITSARENLQEGLKATTHQATLNQHYREYIGTSGKFYQETYKAVRIAASSGIGSDLIPVIEHLLAVMETEQSFERGIPVTREKGDADATAEDPRYTIRGLLEEEKKGLAAQRTLSDSQYNKAVQFFKAKRYGEAYNLFHQSHELSNHNITCRAYIAWLQLRKRVVHRKRLDEHAAQPLTEPTPADLAEGIRTLTDEFRNAKDPLRAAWLLTAIQNDDTLSQATDAATLATLERFAATAVDPREKGRMAGLSTRGGHFINGDLLPVSIALETRKEFGHQYDFEANDAAQNFDVFMQVSFEQMLQWLDKQSDDKLYQYHITLHFKDLFIGKGGDSLGGVMGVCGYSALFNIPVRQRITATGSIRADGVIAAVGGIVAKVQAAIENGKHTVILPADNEADIYLLPADTSEQIRIIIGRNMDDYLFHGLAGAPSRTYEWRRSEGRYRVARLYHRLGLLPQALTLYREVKAVCPNDHSADQHIRLLERRKVIAKPIPWTAHWNGHWQGKSLSPVPLTVNDETPAAAKERLQKIATLSARVATKLINSKHRFEGGYLIDFALLVDPENTTALAHQGRRDRGIAIAVDDAVTKETVEELRSVLRSQLDQLEKAPSTPFLQQVTLLYNMLLMDILQTEEDAVIVAVTRLQKELGETYTFPILLTQISSRIDDWHERGDGKVKLVPEPIDRLLFAERYEAYRESSMGMLLELLRQGAQ